MKKNKLKPFLTGSVFILPALLLLNGVGQETKAMMKSAVNKVIGGIKSTPIKIPNITNGGVKVSSSALNAIKKNVTGSAAITKPTTTTTSSSTSSSLGLSNIKQNKITIPSLTGGGVTVSSGSITSAVKKAGITGATTTTSNKSATLLNTSTSTTNSSNLVSKSNSFSGTTTTKRPAPQPPTSSSNLVSKSNSFSGTTTTKRPAPQPPTSSSTSTSTTSTSSSKPDPGYDTVPKPIFTPKKSGTAVNTDNEVYQNVVIVNTNAGTLTIFKDN